MVGVLPYNRSWTSSLDQYVVLIQTHLNWNVRKATYTYMCTYSKCELSLLFICKYAFE